MTRKRNVTLSARQLQSGCNPDLLPHQIYSGNHFSDRMLHLDPGVHLYKIEISFPIQHKFHRARAPVAHRLCGTQRRPVKGLPLTGF